MMAPVPESVCRSLNQQSYGQAGILKSVHASLNSQCYGDDLNNLTIVSSSSGAELLIVAADPASAGALGTINTAPTPTDTANADWLVAPDAAPTVTAPANPVTGGGAIIAVDGQGQPVSLLTFVDTPVGLVLGTRTAQFKNTTAAAVDLASVSVPSPFSISYEDCSGVSLAPDQTCTVSVAFTPLAAQTYTGSGFAINLVTTAGAHSLLALSGTGLVAAPYISVTSHGFGAVDSPSGFGWMPGQWFGAGTIDPAISSDWVVASAQYSPDGWSINRGAFAQDIVISFPQPSSNMTVTGVTYSYTGRGTVPIDNADVICDTVSCVVTPSALMLEGTGVAPASLTVTVTYSTATITGVVLTRSFPIKLADPWY
ncbi:MAG: hypothetical protein Q7S87_08535 [Agitococcus sp.]|nr:hypothetical protein [Agitococcus sp.]